jgi:hypothetical protein
MHGDEGLSAGHIANLPKQRPQKGVPSYTVLPKLGPNACVTASKTGSGLVIVNP